MTRQGRLSSARGTRWVEKYEGRDIIAGYTPGGAPYGITLEEPEGEAPWFTDED